MKVILGFLYRGTDRSRQEIFSIVKPRVTDLYPWDGVLVEDSGHEPFNRAATRNLIAKKAIELDADVLVLCDADSIPERDQLHEAIRMAQLGICVVPFSKVSIIPHRGVLRSGEDYRSVPELRSYGPSCGGVYVIDPKVYRAIGGQDERIIGWGYEDQIFLVALNTFLGGYHTLDGLLWNFEHPRGADHVAQCSNTAYVDLYHAAEGSETAVRALQVGSNTL
jgi:hypothetical protein